MKILAVADLHGNLPEIEPCDILLIGGDICPLDDHRIDRQADYLKGPVREWLYNDVPAHEVVMIAGNHDYVFEIPSKVPNMPWTYLQDEEVTINGVRIWGTPWVPNLPSWAFHRGFGSCGDWKEIPEGVDILLSHGPMRGYGDRVGSLHGNEEVGCTGMRQAVRRIKPKTFVCGHIHEGFGHYRHPGIEHGIFNVAYVDEYYRVRGQIIEIPVIGRE